MLAMIETDPLAARAEQIINFSSPGWPALLTRTVSHYRQLANILSSKCWLIWTTLTLHWGVRTCEQIINIHKQKTSLPAHCKEMDDLMTRDLLGQSSGGKRSVGTAAPLLLTRAVPVIAAA